MVYRWLTSAASPMTKMQGSPQTKACHTDDGGWGLPCILVVGKAALAANLITQLIFKHLEQNSAAKRLPKCILSQFGCASGQSIDFLFERSQHPFFTGADF